MNEKIKKYIVNFIILGLIIIFLVWTFKDDNKQSESAKLKLYSSSQYYSNNKYYNNYDSEIISRDDAIDDYWSDIRDYLSGTETIEACRVSGNCYDLDADIYTGIIDTIYFYNGGHLNFGVEIDEDGYANEYDQNGDEWEFFLDMDSSLVDDAVEEWAEDNDYTVE